MAPRIVHHTFAPRGELIGGNLRESIFEKREAANLYSDRLGQNAGE
jgi:hypothetical protein